jgi:hypothetical protein
MITFKISVVEILEGKRSGTGPLRKEFGFSAAKIST